MKSSVCVTNWILMNALVGTSRTTRYRSNGYGNMIVIIILHEIYCTVKAW